MNDVTVVTCTGQRPELFALCRKWVLRQTRKPARWLIVVDCDDTPDAPEAEIQRLPDSFTIPPCSHPSAALRAISYALTLVSDAHDVVVMEDDDWYGASYIEEVLAPPCAFSHQRRMYQCHLPAERYSVCDYPEPVEGMLAFKAGNAERIRSWLLRRPHGDSLQHESEGIEMSQLVQVKGVGFGLPGRTGATRKHVTEHRKVQIMQPDPGNKTFQRLVGVDAHSYLSLLKTPCV